MKRIKTSHKHAVFAALMLTLSLSSWAADIGAAITRPIARGSAGSTTVNVTGTITAKPCDLNGGKDLDYAFGDVVVNDVTGEKHSITHSLTVECHSANEQAQIQFVGTAATVGSNAGESVLQAGGSGLGISLANSNFGITPIKLNTYIDVAASSTINLKATLVHLDPTKVLTAGDFSAALTIETRYQ